MLNFDPSTFELILRSSTITIDIRYNVTTALPNVLCTASICCGCITNRVLPDKSIGVLDLNTDFYTHWQFTVGWFLYGSLLFFRWVEAYCRFRNNEKRINDGFWVISESNIEQKIFICPTGEHTNHFISRKRYEENNMYSPFKVEKISMPFEK